MRSWLLLVVAGCGFQHGAAQGTADAPAGDAFANLCTPAAVDCDGRVRKVCGADGHWDASADQICDYTCALGACVAPSNVPVASVAACTASAPRLAPPAGGSVVLTASGGTHLDCTPDCGDPAVTRIDPVATLTAPTPDLSWFCLASIDLPAGVTLGLPATGGPTEAIAFVVDGTVSIAGTIDFDGHAATSAVPGGEGAPGGYDGGDLTSGVGIDGHGPCPGKGGNHDGSSSHWIGGGGGGGGYATAGGGGGTGRCTNNDHTGTGNVGGTVCGAPALVPLVGGSGGGGGGDATTGSADGWAGGGGGGALQISSRTTIAITGSVRARGGDGYGGSAIDGGGGGGAGGALLLEARSLTASGSLIVDGGNGGMSGAGAGGAGATAGTGPGSGLTFTSAGQGGSGGGGGGGRIRINTATAAPSSCPATASPSASCTTGALPPQ